MSNCPQVMEGRVVQVDVPNRSLVMDFPSTQMSGIRVRMGYHGPADGIRVSHKAMPGRGSWGLVMFPYGDSRNGVWVCSIYPNQLDALTTDTDQFMEYDSHWSGAYEVLDGEGRWTKSFPDGTYIQVSDTTAKPATFRHTVDPSQNQQLTPFPDTDRVPNPPAARIVNIQHASGAFVQIDAAGNVNVNVASGKNVQMSAGGGATQYTLVRTDLFVAMFNAHIHRPGSGGNTGTPVTQISATDVQSTLTDVSE